MVCDECENSDSAAVRVAFTAEKAITLRLCEECVAKFRESRLIDAVDPLE